MKAVVDGGAVEEVDINEGTANNEVESGHSEWEKSVSLKRKRAPVLSSSSDEEKRENQQKS